MSVSNIASQNEVESADLMIGLARFVRRANLMAAGRILLIGCAAWLVFVFVAMAVDYFSEIQADARWWCSRGSAVASIIAPSCP